jgi:hypothetical protein
MVPGVSRTRARHAARLKCSSRAKHGLMCASEQGLGGYLCEHEDKGGFKRDLQLPGLIELTASEKEAGSRTILEYQTPDVSKASAIWNRYLLGIAARMAPGPLVLPSLSGISYGSARHERVPTPLGDAPAERGLLLDMGTKASAGGCLRT